MKVCWISAGVSSFVAGWLERDTIDKFLYIDIADQQADSIRFIHDCEKALGKEVEILKSDEYETVEDCVRTFGGFRNVRNGFAPCTNWMKKRVRKRFEDEHSNENLTYVWGFDSNERHRAERILEPMPNFEHCFPLIERNLTKEDAHGILQDLKIKRPLMYDLGYRNNNCVGCVKGGMGYWNRIRRDFPDVFESRARLERELNNTIINGVFLDELDTNRGRIEEEVFPECSIFCQLATLEG